MSWTLPILWLGLSGCKSQIATGDYVVFRVAFEAAELDSGCYPDGIVPESVAEDESSFLGVSVFILYFGPNEEVFLNTGVEVLAGSRDKDLFKFDGESTDSSGTGTGGTYTTPYYGDTYTYGGYDTGAAYSLTTVHSLAVEFTNDKGSITGDWVSNDQITCSGECDGIEPIDCKTTIKFVGAQLDDVELPLEPSEAF